MVLELIEDHASRTRTDTSDSRVVVIDDENAKPQCKKRCKNRNMQCKYMNRCMMQCVNSILFLVRVCKCASRRSLRVSRSNIPSSHPEARRECEIFQLAVSRLRLGSRWPLVRPEIPISYRVRNILASGRNERRGRLSLHLGRQRRLGAPPFGSSPRASVLKNSRLDVGSTGQCGKR